MEELRSFNKALLLVGGEKIGGAEKRFGRAFLYMQEKDESVFLIINEMLYDALIRHGIPLNICKNVLLIRGRHYRNPTQVLMIISALQLALKINKVIRETDIKIVHSLQHFPIINFILFHLLKNIRKGISVVDPDVDIASRGNPLATGLLKAVIKRSDFIECLSQDIKEKFIKKYGKNFHGTFYVSPCSFTDYSLINNPNGKKENSVVFMARLVHYKNPMLFVNAIPYVVNALNGKFSDLIFYIAGEGPLEDELKNRVGHLGIEQYVVFAYVYSPTELFCKSKIFVSLQVSNNYPSQSLLEAMACKNAIVATDVGETWKLVDDATGIRVKPDAKELAQAIMKLLNNPEILQKMGEKAKEKVLKGHTVERFADYLFREVYVS